MASSNGDAKSVLIAMTVESENDKVIFSAEKDEPNM
jgi:hypothetical protein